MTKALTNNTVSASFFFIYTSKKMNNTENVTYLAHHGILGQKWGVRRYQNKDGSLTNAGKKHLAKENTIERLTKQAKEIDSNSEYGRTYKAWKKKNPTADEDDFGDYLAEKHPTMERSNISQKMINDAHRLSDSYVAEQTTGIAILSSVLLAPVSALVVGKTTHSKKAAAIAAVGTVAGMSANEFIDSTKKQRATLEEYGLK